MSHRQLAAALALPYPTGTEIEGKRMRGSRPKTRPTKAQCRRLVLDRARELFAAQGYAATSLEQLAEETGLTPALVARSFPEKVAVLCGLVEELQASMFAAPAAPDAPNWTEKLHNLLRVFHLESRSKTSSARVLLALLSEGHAETRSALAEALKLLVDALAELVKGGQQAGVFRSLDPEQAAWELLRTLFGRTLLEGFERVSRADPEQSPQGVDCLLHGLLKTDV
jgi:AcrR family transcriptional regulator